MKKNVIIVLLIAFVLHSCNNKEEKNLPKIFDYGKIENGVYNNDFFNFSYAYPSGWSTLDKKELNTFEKESLELVIKDKEMKSRVKASMINVATLFSSIKKPIGRNAEFTPTIIMNCENLSKYGASMDVETYLEQAKKIINQSEMDITFKSEQVKKIGGQEFLNLVVDNNAFGTLITQEYYIAIINDFAFNIIFSYIKEEDKKTLMNSLNTLKFN